MSRLKKSFIIAIIFSIITLLLIIPAVLLDNDIPKFWATIPSSIVIYFIYPSLMAIFKGKWPSTLQLIICIQCLFGLSFASAFNMYEIFSFWDMILHGLLGVEAMAFGYFLMINTVEGRINLFGKIIFLFTFVMGIAAIWEIIEYTGYNLFDIDFQHMYDRPASDTPLDDTMWDIIIALITSFITFMVYVVDSLLFNRKLNDRTYKAFKLGKDEENDL